MRLSGCVHLAYSFDGIGGWVRRLLVNLVSLAVCTLWNFGLPVFAGCGAGTVRGAGM